MENSKNKGFNYRIVSRYRWVALGPADYPVYYAQQKVFDRWWMDCRLNPFINSYSSYGPHLKYVENWVQEQIYGKNPEPDEVVRTYE